MARSSDTRSNRLHYRDKGNFPRVNVLLPVGKALSVAGVIIDGTVLGRRQVSALEER
jgi:hypothetical protein